MPWRVRIATLLAFILHGVFILTARYRISYDAYTHMLFADHYRQNWWSLWDPRWYAGFSVTSYPPLVHQLIGLIGIVVGVDAGYAILSWMVLATYPIGAYVFARVFVDQVSAEYAALGAALLPSIFLAGYTFGQLPTLTGTLMTLFFSAALAEFLKTGQRLSGVLSVMLVAVILGAHHATLMFLPWLVIAITLTLSLNRQVSLKKLLTRLIVLVPFAVVAGLLVIWPFWRWGLDQTMQIPIDHASRHNFFADRNAAIVFFLSIYGPLVILIPVTLQKLFTRHFFGLSLAFLCLVLLGLGGTTPLPRWLFGPGWEWLTYDRFSFWATLLLLPVFGLLLARLAQNRPVIPIAGLLLNRPMAFPQRFAALHTFLACNRPWIAIFGSLAISSALVSLYPTLLPTQPKPVDMQPIIQFLDQGDRSQWRYLTFGFGDQFAYLNRLTQATTIDGSYHTARALPELRDSGIAQIDSVYWLAPDLKPLDPILQAASRYGVRWGFVDYPAYIPALVQHGWSRVTVLSDGVQIWENPAAVLPTTHSAPPDDPLESFSWGTLPILALTITAGLAGLRLRPALAVQALQKIYLLAIGLLPVGLVFWYYRQLTNISYTRVYFSYDNALFFASDVIALISVLAWALVHWFQPVYESEPMGGWRSHSRTRWSKSVTPWIFMLCCLATLSTVWAIDWRLSLYISLHLWLGLALFASLRSRPDAWRAAMIGFCVALAIQVIAGFAEFALQSTDLLTPIHLNWPGGLEPSMRGASVVQLIDGTRWLRVYGTLPHPNILGTFLVVLLLGPVAYFLLAQRRPLWSIILVSSGVILLILAFSRGAWVGFSASACVIAIKYRSLDRRRLLFLAATVTIIIMVAIFPLHALVYTRIAGASNVPTEAFSIKGRNWLTGQAISVIQQHPLLGIGIGSFIINLAQHARPGYIIEPVHSLSFLVVSELGLGGAVILLGLAWVISRRVWQVRTPQGVLISAGLIGLCVTSLFDHSLWTLAPGRIFLMMALGLWAGQVEQER